MEYSIIESFKAEEVAEKVNERLGDRWELYGNLTVAATHDEVEGRERYLYAQAMIRGRKEEWTTS